jgi:hypothetical protein
MFVEPKTKMLAAVVKVDSPANSRKSANSLKKMFKEREHRDSKVRIKRAAVLAYVRSRAMLKKKDLSSKEKAEFREIAGIYKKAYKLMILD